MQQSEDLHAHTTSNDCLTVTVTGFTLRGVDLQGPPCGYWEGGKGGKRRREATGLLAMMVSGCGGRRGGDIRLLMMLGRGGYRTGQCGARGGGGGGGVFRKAKNCGSGGGGPRG